MDNKLVIGIVIGAIALLALAIFATQPVGQAMLRYTVVPVSGTGVIADPNTATMWLGEYTTKVYDNFICKKKYTIETLIISDTTPYSAKFKVNGETTDALYKNNAYTFTDGSKITVLELLPNEGSESSGSDMVKIRFYCPKNTAPQPIKL
jgi:hypothetical protein